MKKPIELLYLHWHLDEKSNKENLKEIKKHCVADFPWNFRVIFELNKL